MAAWASTCRCVATVPAVQLMYHCANTWTACTGECQPPRTLSAGAGVGISWVRWARATVARKRAAGDGPAAPEIVVVATAVEAVAVAARSEPARGGEPTPGRPQPDRATATAVATIA